MLTITLPNKSAKTLLLIQTKSVKVCAFIACKEKCVVLPWCMAFHECWGLRVFVLQVALLQTVMARNCPSTSSMILVWKFLRKGRGIQWRLFHLCLQRSETNLLVLLPRSMRNKMWASCVWCWKFCWFNSFSLILNNSLIWAEVWIGDLHFTPQLTGD